MSGMMTLAIDVRQQLRHVETMLLTENDLRRHLPNFMLSRSTGNRVCELLVELTGHTASVELFVHAETHALLSIQVLVARDLNGFRIARERLHREFETTNGTTAGIINLIPSRSVHR